MRRGFTLTELAIVVFLTVGVMAALLLPALRSARPAARRSQCKNNLKNIGLALHNYRDEHGTFPPLVTVSEDGRPLHSWRTLLLPHMEQRALYETIDLSKPWDDPANALAAETAVPQFACPEHDGGPLDTIYFAVGPFPTEEEIEAFGGPAIMPVVVEGTREDTRPWMQPADFGRPIEAYDFPPGEFPHHGVQATFADGTVRFMPAEMVPRSRDPEVFERNW